MWPFKRKIRRDVWTGQPLDQWANQQWARWESCNGGWTANGRSVCPFCYAVTVAEDARYMAQNHKDVMARKRWRGHVTTHEAEMAALKACRCSNRIQPGQAAEEAQRELSRFRFF